MVVTLTALEAWRVTVALGQEPFSAATLSVARTATRLFLGDHTDYLVMAGEYNVTGTRVPEISNTADMKTVALLAGVPNDRILMSNWSSDLPVCMAEALQALRARNIITRELIVVTLPGKEAPALSAAGKAFHRLAAHHISVVPSDYLFPEGDGDKQS